MPTIHPTAIIEGDVTLADDVEVGPHCVIRGTVRVGAGTRLIGSVYLTGPLTLGTANVVYPFACLGFAPQHAKYDPREPGCGLAIGDGNTIREQVIVHRAFTDEGPTRIGDGNLLMATSHVGHDCRVADGCTIVTGAVLAGHVELGGGVTVGGHAGIHQFVRVGRGAMVGGGAHLSADLLPYFLVTGRNICRSVNLVGARRSGMPRVEVDRLRWIHQTIYRRGWSTARAVAALRENAGEPLVDECLRFIDDSKRGICRARASNPPSCAVSGERHG
ncbi:MAG: acyl-ACP--UDP-N-acetylglucosamine O-acyltransferase [Phycisphaerales bacterium]|nr:acyl-ACP--UDP-N-acetylglucosamine O-acyltransferase [Phycisphaerae bacterium]NNF44831.1 acyl-ACP--UDP-N-acetylglucosamine O-acyltransferase [Phycisphaerales bacterium]NNM24804.1 acyl-ACP--UDP-N-acetylglucosamine O-acyltransferase [Phycisphaerales bacterium]